MNLPAIQSALRERNIDAWLFYDHHRRDPIAYRVLGLPNTLMVTRRWFYLIPAEGEPTKLVHKIEAGHLDTLPGSKRKYAGWQELFENIKAILGPHRDIAMQYSPNNSVFTVSLVDAGTVELVRGLGKNVVSSADLVAQFEATFTDEQMQSHFAARDAIDNITAAAFQEIGRRVPERRHHRVRHAAMVHGSFRPRAPRHRRSAHRGRKCQQRESALRAAGRVISRRFAKATLCCWTSGPKKTRRAPFITTSRGPGLLARRLPTSSARFSRSSATAVTPE